MAQAFWCGFTDVNFPGEDYYESSINYWGSVSASTTTPGVSMILETPNVSTIPGSTQPGNSTSVVGCGLIYQNSGFLTTNTKWGILSPMSSSLPLDVNSYFIYGSVDIDEWYSEKGSEQNQFPGRNGHIKYRPFEAFYAALGNPQNITRTVSYYHPHFLPTDSSIYTAIKINSEGAPQFYQTSNTSGNLAMLLSTIYPSPGYGSMPLDYGGNITTNMTDEQAAAVWLSNGYPLYLGDEFGFCDHG